MYIYNIYIACYSILDIPIVMTYYNHIYIDCVYNNIVIKRGINSNMLCLFVYIKHMLKILYITFHCVDNEMLYTIYTVCMLYIICLCYTANIKY